MSNADLKSFVDRLYEREKEKQEVSRDCREIKTEAKAAGLNPSAIARIVRDKLRDAEKAAKEAAVAETVEQYKTQLGLPL